jgi:hypothetical protein
VLSNTVEIEAQCRARKNSGRPGRKTTFDDLLPIILSYHAINTFGFCAPHRKRCYMRPGGKTEYAGIPCTDWTEFGHEEREGGKTMKYVAAWACLRRHFQEPIIVVENSRKFDQTLLERSLPMYTIMPNLICPTTMGMTGRRMRAWIILVHSQSILSVWGLYSNTTDLWTRVLHGTFHAIMIASEAELKEELDWALSRRKSRLEELIVWFLHNRRAMPSLQSVHTVLVN